MAAPRFSIGIDLGTTNSAMAFVPLAQDAATEVFTVPQRDSFSTLSEHATLPSFLYLPEDAGTDRLQGRAPATGEWIIGLLARKKAHEVPGRVAHSAKSWLCHHAADREAPFLPWGSEDVPPADKISPVRASALILDYLRSAWNNRFAAAGPEYGFDAQEITIAVPASFDAAAQRLTLTAAEQARYPDTVRLLEEPQAAFYNWLEQHDPKDLWSNLPPRNGECWHILVVDIGGGTSDFSLFEVRPGTPAPKVKRLAVGEHILLGGDNVDLAIAHLVEPRLVRGDGKPSAASWDDLVARCRDIKERALSGRSPPDEVFAISLPGRGASLVANALSARLTRGEIESVLLDGFYPECAADVRVRRTHTALKEWGLPYAADSAITHHLAAFLQGRGRIDAVLFNGGALYPELVRDRLCQVIGKWFDSSPPPALVNAEPDLAVARGAARFGKLVHCQGERIEAGAARAVFIEAHQKPAEGGGPPAPSLVCILPRGAAPEQAFEIRDLSLRLRVNRLVRFQTYSSPRHGRCKAGDIIPSSEADLHALPPLQTVAKLDDAARSEAGRTLPITLTAKLSELGLLQVACRSAEPGIRRSWPLDFDLRPHQQGDQDASPMPVLGAAAQPNAAPEALDEARRRLHAFFTQPPDPRNKLTAARVLQALEKILGAPKGDWNWVLVRALWSPLAACSSQRRLSVDHEEAWLILAGFLLRPGFGADADESRIDALWSTRENGFFFSGKRIKLQEYILWRRVAGGLARERQQAVLTAELDKLRAPKGPPPELILLAGSLERLGHELKAELIEQFIAAAADLAQRGGHAAPYLAALGLLLNRAPLYAGPETVVPPKLVEHAYDALFRLDWAASEVSELHTLFLRAARVVDDRSLDVAPALRGRIADKLEKMGVAPLKTAKLRAFVPVTASERPGLFGERLPPGLILGEPRP
jgi:molecular chaperone DnaK (HSP70)